MQFSTRKEAGLQLAKKLKKYKLFNPLILALPRGGVPVGYEIAKMLHASLDVFVVRKIGSPHSPEFGIGAIAEGGVQYINTGSVELFQISKKSIDEVIKKESRELARRIRVYRKDSSSPKIKGRVVILVDDGLATGVTAMAAIQALTTLQPQKIILAVPVGASDTHDEIEPFVDEIVCLLTVKNLRAIGKYYKDFSAVTDEEVLRLLQLKL